MSMASVSYSVTQAPLSPNQRHPRRARGWQQAIAGPNGITLPDPVTINVQRPHRALFDGRIPQPLPILRPRDHVGVIRRSIQARCTSGSSRALRVGVIGWQELRKKNADAKHNRVDVQKPHPKVPSIDFKQAVKHRCKITPARFPILSYQDGNGQCEAAELYQPITEAKTNKILAREIRNCYPAASKSSRYARLWIPFSAR